MHQFGALATWQAAAPLPCSRRGLPTHVSVLVGLRLLAPTTG